MSVVTDYLPTQQPPPINFYHCHPPVVSLLMLLHMLCPHHCAGLTPRHPSDVLTCIILPTLFCNRGPSTGLTVDCTVILWGYEDKADWGGGEMSGNITRETCDNVCNEEMLEVCGCLATTCTGGGRGAACYSHSPCFFDCPVTWTVEMLRLADHSARPAYRGNRGKCRWWNRITKSHRWTRMWLRVTRSLGQGGYFVFKLTLLSQKKKKNSKNVNNSSL